MAAFHLPILHRSPQFGNLKTALAISSEDNVPEVVTINFHYDLFPFHRDESRKGALLHLETSLLNSALRVIW
jgi:hypothetical protein